MNKDESKKIRSGFDKLGTGFFWQAMAFLGLFIILCFSYLSTQNTVDNIETVSLTETTDKLQGMLSLIKYGTLLCLLILIISTFYLAFFSIEPIEEEKVNEG